MKFLKEYLNDKKSRWLKYVNGTYISPWLGRFFILSTGLGVEDEVKSASELSQTVLVFC